MKKLFVPALLSLGVLFGGGVSFAGDGWLTALTRHVRSDLLHSENAAFDFHVNESFRNAPGFTVSGEKIHLENGILNAHFNSIKGDDGTDIETVDSMSHMSLGGDFLSNPIKHAVDAMLAYTDMSASKVSLAFTVAAPQKAPGSLGVEILSMPARNLHMTLRDGAMETTLKSVVPIKAAGTVSYRSAEKKIDMQITGAWSGPIPIPEALVFATLKNTIHYPFVDIHKPYVTIDIGYFLEGSAPNKN